MHAFVFVHSCCTATKPASRPPLPLKHHSTLSTTWRPLGLHCRRPFSYPAANVIRRFFFAGGNVSSSLRPSTSTYPGPDEVQRAKFSQVAERLYDTSRYFKKLGGLGFWGQLICTLVAAVTLSFSIFLNQKISSPAIFYSAAGGIAAAFISVFWSFGYLRLSDELQKSANMSTKAPSCADVVRSLKNCIILNMLGMGASIFGLQAKVGVLATKALVSSRFLRQILSSTNNSLLPQDIFLVLASVVTISSHFLGLLCSLELLRFWTL